VAANPETVNKAKAKRISSLLKESPRSTTHATIARITAKPGIETR
jgi:hypothetical protein